MTASFDLCHLLQTTLAAASDHDRLEPFLESVLQEALDLVGAAGLAVVRSNPPEWQVVCQVGQAKGPVPTEIAAETLDRGKPVSSGPWHALALGEQYALLARGMQKPDRLEPLAQSLDSAIQTVLATQQRHQRIRRLETILDITHAWAQTNCMEALLQSMAEAATELLAADRASIFLWDRANKTLVARPALGMDDNELRFADDTGIVGQVIHSREPRRVGGGLGEDQIDRAVDEETGYQTETILCVPLISPKGDCLGAFEVLNKRQGAFTDEDERGLIELAAHAAVALETTQQFEQLLTTHQQLVEQAAEGVQLIGQSPAIEAVRSTIGRIADTDLAILILGENGTGKEVVARSIHYFSRRRDQPFIAVNCAALSETLLESELFGHEKGAFTDAHETRAGKFELASGGTLFLDEIGDMSPSGQAKLLRVLEDKTVVRVGGSQPIHTEVRILAATNQNLAAMVAEKRFREDLFFRLNVVSLDLPPLRDREGDILLLADHFLHAFCANMGRRTPKFSAAAQKRLLAHPWPGNVRELRNLTERLAYLSAGNQIESEDLAFIDAHSTRKDTPEGIAPDCTLSDATQQFQQRYIRQSIEAASGNMSNAAKQLGLHRSNLYRKMRLLGMESMKDEA